MQYVGLIIDAQSIIYVGLKNILKITHFIAEIFFIELFCTLYFLITHFLFIILIVTLLELEHLGEVWEQSYSMIT